MDTLYHSVAAATVSWLERTYWSYLLELPGSYAARYKASARENCRLAFRCKFSAMRPIVLLRELLAPFICFLD